MRVSAAAPVLAPMSLGTGGGEEKEGKHEHTLKNQLRFQGGKSQRRRFPYSSPPQSSRWGEGACCGVGVRQSCCCADPSISAHPAYGEVQQFQHHLWDFPEGTISQLVIQSVLPVLFWKNGGIFREVRGHHWLGLTFTLVCFYQKAGKWLSVLVNLNTVNFVFSLRVLELTSSDLFTI